MKSFLKETAITLVVAFAIFIILQLTIQSSPVLGSSMEPTLQGSGQRLLISRITYLFHEPQRGDIITFHPPLNPPNSRPYIKRIIGLPGETVSVHSGKVYINGYPLTEPYIKAPPNYIVEATVVPINSYFVLGDNRNISDDSHLWGVVPRQDIIGKAWLSLWPPRTWGLAPNYYFAN